MAKIHGISGSTRYLLDGTLPIHGNRLATLEDIIQFQKNYQEILAETEIGEAKRQDEIILASENNETELDQQLQEDIDKRTRDVYSHILEINDRIEASDSIFVILVYLIRFWGANLVSTYRIHLPLTGVKWNLWRIRKQKEKAITDKTRAISSAGKNITESEQFLNRNDSLLVDAKAEEYIVGVLSALPDEYHIINGVNLHFFDPIYWYKRKEQTGYCSIDLIVIGPTGLFLVGIKNWKGADIEIKTGDLKRQVRLVNYALWCYLKDEYRIYEMNPKIRCVIVSLQGTHPDLRIDKSIDVINPDGLCEYITAREEKFTKFAIRKLIHLLPFRGAQ
ncbi:MAG: NERD domain-containing protein [Methanoregula sp.]|nr:NERD domain-containing protein [Methanoregula sp.]